MRLAESLINTNIRSLIKKKTYQCAIFALYYS